MPNVTAALAADIHQVEEELRRIRADLRGIVSDVYARVDETKIKAIRARLAVTAAPRAKKVSA